MTTEKSCSSKRGENDHSGEQKVRKIRVKRYFLFDSRLTWDHDVSISDPASDAEAFVSSLYLICTGRCLF